MHDDANPMAPINRAQVHRFRDMVAVYLGENRTVYLEPGDAEAVALAMRRCAQDCCARPFTKSEFRSWTMGVD